MHAVDFSRASDCNGGTHDASYLPEPHGENVAVYPGTLRIQAILCVEIGKGPRAEMKGAIPESSRCDVSLMSSGRSR